MKIYSNTQEHAKFNSPTLLFLASYLVIVIKIGI